MSDRPAEGFRVMGVINVTPDSFSDGGRYLDAAAAIEHGLVLEAQGAAILDVGGESTRPGSRPVPAPQERERVIPVIRGLIAAGARAQVSVDTSKAEVADAALDAGASIVNDVTALRGDPQMASLVAARGVEICLMHMLGEPGTMQLDPRYGDVVAEVRGFLRERIEVAIAAGVESQRIMIDPGIGFGKTPEHNLELLSGLGEIAALGASVVIGTSRKSFLGKLTGREVEQRLTGTITTNVIAYERGARVFRVHDVGPVHDALKIAAATVSARWRPAIPTNTTAT